MLFAVELIIVSMAMELVASEASCAGAPCADVSHCRSRWGWCGSSDAYCNDQSTWKASCDSDVTTTTNNVVTTTASGFLATTTTTTTLAGVTDFVPCTYSKTFTYEGWPVQQDSTDVQQMVDRCQGTPLVNTADTATCIINSHASGYDYDKWTPESACPYPLGVKPSVSQATCQAEFARWKDMGVTTVTLPGGIQARTAIGHGVLTGVRGECALLEFEGRYAVVFQLDIRSWSLELTESTLMYLTNDVAPGGHCFTPNVQPFDCASVTA